MRRSVRAAMRDAVMVATAPFSKRMRALAMSACSLATAAPTASTLSIEVENHRHVGAAQLERSDARGLDIERRAELSLDRGEGGREAFLVAHLQHQPSLRGKRGKFVGLIQRSRDRLFHQHMLAGAQRCNRKRMMRLGRDRDDQRIAGPQQCRKIEVRRAGFPAHRLGALRIRIMHAHQLGALGFRYLERVITAEMAGSGDADAKAGR